MKVIFHSIYKSNTFFPNKQINSKLFFIKLSFFHKPSKQNVNVNVNVNLKCKSMYRVVPSIPFIGYCE